MRPIHTFKRGGIRMDGRREWDPALPVRNAFLPNGAIVLLKQHAGAPARCLVRRGEFVREGMLIGLGEGPDAANVHAPIPGVVRDIRAVRLVEGGECAAVVIALEGAFDRLGKRDERYLWDSMSRRDILNTMRERGVVDTEPPGLPLHELLGGAKPRLAVLNAVESEPYLRSENCLFRDKTAEVLTGFAIVRKVVGPDRGVVATDDPELAAAVEAAPAAGGPVECRLLAPRYPQDMRRRLEEACSDEPERRGADEAPLIVRPSTAFALYEAIVLAKPVLERYVTVAGGAIKRPSVFKARIGTPIGDLVEECGGFRWPPARLVIGGPIRGYAVHDLDVPVTKTCSTVLALTQEEIGSSRRTACIRCGRCAEACPEGLDPDILFRLVKRRALDRATELGLGRCTACGACGYVCPSRMPLVATLAASRAASADASAEALR